MASKRIGELDKTPISTLKQQTMEGELSKYSISEHRDELMVSPTGGSPIYRAARFLKPTATAIEGPRPNLPSLPFSSEDGWPLSVAFNGLRAPQSLWKKWVDDMRAKNLPVWISAGIDEAIMCSVYNIKRNVELVVGLAERWCSETNTFVFAWGEATITLEDIMVLGGFSVLGEPVKFALDEEPELKEIEQNLEGSRKDMEILKLDNHTRWLKLFMGGGSNVEHEAFLSLWLSRFVFPCNDEYNRIDKHVFPVAIRLARGIKIALAPPVLASIYKDLGYLRETMEMVISDLTSVDGITVYAVPLWAPLQLVQMWAWERMIPLRPSPNYINPGELRVARWDNLNNTRSMNVRESIDSCGESFLWRPYALAIDNLETPKFYKENEQWVDDSGEDLDEKIKSFMRCLRVCELVGLDCKEPYRPNRVAMQFGFDQDIPQWIPRSSNISAEDAWCEYSKPIGAVNIPPRLLESDVTVRYLEWWRRSVLLLPSDANQRVLHGRRKRSQKNIITQTSNNNNAFDENAENENRLPHKGKSVSEGNEHSANEGCEMLKRNAENRLPPESNVLSEGNEHTSMTHSANEGCEMPKRNEENMVDNVPPGVTPRATFDNHDELEARIAKLEKLVAWFKKQK